MKIRLYCFPYAGGSASLFCNWKELISPAIELRPVELSGRGLRAREPLYKDLDELIEDVISFLEQEGFHLPYALFGHSMGSLICYELTRRIISKGLPLPRHIFFSGGAAPHVHPVDKKKFHLMNDDEFRTEVIRLGGTPPEFFDHPELLDYFLPLLKNDFKIADTEVCNGAIFPLPVNITVFLGKDDDLTPEQCDGWKKHSQLRCTIHYFDGGHFFLHERTAQLIGLVNTTLLPGCPMINEKRACPASHSFSIKES